MVTLDYYDNIHTRYINSDFSYFVYNIYSLGLVSFISRSSHFIKFSKSLIDNILTMCMILPKYDGIFITFVTIIDIRVRTLDLTQYLW